LLFDEKSITQGKNRIKKESRESRAEGKGMEGAF
jgi:hypothetical protein